MTAWPDEALEYCKKRWKDRATASEISVELWTRFRLSVSRSAICGKMNRAGLSNKGPRHSDGVQKDKRQRISSQKRVAKNPSPVKEPIRIKDITGIFPHVAGLPLEKVNNQHCRYLFSSDARYPLFCGFPDADVSGGRPYCAYHAKIVYTPAVDNRKPRQHGKRYANF